MEPVLRDHCHERQPVLKDHIFLAVDPTLQGNWTCHHIFTANGVVFQHRFYYSYNYISISHLILSWFLYSILYFTINTLRESHRNSYHNSYWVLLRTELFGRREVLFTGGLLNCKILPCLHTSISEAGTDTAAKAARSSASASCCLRSSSWSSRSWGYIHSHTTYYIDTILPQRSLRSYYSNSYYYNLILCHYYSCIIIPNLHTKVPVHQFYILQVYLYTNLTYSIIFGYLSDNRFIITLPRRLAFHLLSQPQTEHQ